MGLYTLEGGPTDKLIGQSVGGKSRWSCQTMESLLSTSQMDQWLPSSQEKTELLASYFSAKVSVPKPNVRPLRLPPQTLSRLYNVSISVQKVKRELEDLDVAKAVGPDESSPHALVVCQSAGHTTYCTVQACMTQQTWPKLWKASNIGAIHIKYE